MSNPKWQNNGIQFPRLLAEILATQDGLDMAALAASMDLSVEEVAELFDRANQEWEDIKSGRPVGLEAVMMDGKIGVVADPMDGWVARSFGDATKFSGATPLAAAKSCWLAGQQESVENLQRRIVDAAGVVISFSLEQSASDVIDQTLEVTKLSEAEWESATAEEKIKAVRQAYRGEV